jgi:hypothetical protein
MDEPEVAAILRRRVAEGRLAFSEHFHRRNALPERRYDAGDICCALAEQPLVLEAGMGKWLAVNRVRERYITVVFTFILDEEVLVVTAYPSKAWERFGWLDRRRR